MKKYSSLVVAIMCGMILIVSGCSASGSSHQCNNNDSCDSKASCSAETGSCASWESPLAISPNYSWKDATIGTPYEVDFEASGGIPPYTWILNDGDPTTYPYPSWLVLTPAVGDTSKAKLQNIASQLPLITDITSSGASIPIKITVKDNTVKGNADRPDNKGASITQALKINGCPDNNCPDCANISNPCQAYASTDCSGGTIRKCWANEKGCIVWFAQQDLACNPNETCTVAGDGTVSCICNIGSTDCHRCNKDSDCQEGHCECANNTCSATRCSTVSCNCGYTTDGSACAGKLDPDVNDIHDTCGLGSCDGKGNCLKADSAACSNSPECRPNHYCECGDFNCTTRICSSTECKCQYAAQDGQSCAGPLTRGLADFVGRCKSPDYCDGTGGCTVANGSSCTEDYNCRSSLCDCQNPACDIKQCAGLPCTCQYTVDGSTCNGPINDDTDDPHHTCASNLLCNGLGGCNIATGGICTSNQSCQTNQCACTTPSCNPAICVTQKCGNACYVTDPNNTSTYCSTAAYPNYLISYGVNNPGKCDGLSACNGSGSCKGKTGHSCRSGDECLSNICNCSYSSCTTCQ